MIPPPGFIHCSLTCRPRRFASQQPANQERSLMVGFAVWAKEEQHSNRRRQIKIRVFITIRFPLEIGANVRRRRERGSQWQAKRRHLLILTVLDSSLILFRFSRRPSPPTARS